MKMLRKQFLITMVKHYTEDTVCLKSQEKHSIRDHLKFTNYKDFYLHNTIASGKGLTNYLGGKQQKFRVFLVCRRRKGY